MKIPIRFKKLLKSIKRYSPELLTGIGIAGMIFSTCKAVECTPKAIKIIENTKKEPDEDLKLIEKIKLTWKCYIPSASITICSIACIVGASATNRKRTAALTTACTLSSTALKEYKDSVVKVVGESKNDEIKRLVAKEKIKKTDQKKISVDTQAGEKRFIELYTGQIFTSDIESIRKAINDVNDQMRNNMYVSLNDLFYELGIMDRTRAGDVLGWNLEDGFVEARSFDSAIVYDGNAYIVLDYKNPPTVDFEY